MYEEGYEEEEEESSEAEDYEFLYENVPELISEDVEFYDLLYDMYLTHFNEELDRIQKQQEWEELELIELSDPDDEGFLPGIDDGLRIFDPFPAVLPELPDLNFEDDLIDDSALFPDEGFVE